MLRLIDANNLLLRELQQDRTGLLPRTIFNRALTSTVPEIWVWDGQWGNERRRKIYPEYKRNRTSKDDSIYRALSYIAELLVYTKAIQVVVPRYEADDVIASIAMKADCPVTIESTDYDFEQLRSDRITPMCRSRGDVKPDEVRLYKSLVGDMGDNIKGIPNFGPKAWERCNKAELEELMLFDQTTKVETGMTQKQETYLIENLDTLRGYYEIVGFFDVPMDLIDKHTTVGVPSRELGEATLKRYMQ